MEKVKVYVKISGDYCAFHEMSFNVVYDITNNIQLEYDTLEELENWDRDENGGYSDVEQFDAILVDGKYYVSLS